MTVGFRVDPKDAVPIWRQIELGTKRLIASRALLPGGALPSVRDLARELRVNPMTVSRAYQRLADEGIVEVRRGEGTFVVDGHPADSLGSRLSSLSSEADRLASAARALGLGETEGVREVRKAFARLAGPPTRKEREKA